MELGVGFTFVARQKRLQIDNDDFFIDLLFYNRKLKRLVAVELKVGDFRAEYKGQMELYLRWLARYEQEPDENPPLLSSWRHSTREICGVALAADFRSNPDYDEIP